MSNDKLNWLSELNTIVSFLYGVCIIYGLANNIIILLVCLRSTLRKIPTFIYIAVGAIVNSASLFCTPLNNFLGEFILDFNPRDESLFLCKSCYYLTFFLLHWSVWILVLSNLEIYLTVKIIRFRPVYSNPRIALLSCLAIGLLFAILNVPKIFLHGFEENLNGTSKVYCLKSTHGVKKLELIGQTANAVLYSFAPTIIIFVVNILLFRELTRSKLKLTNIREKKIRMRLENRRLAKTHLFLSLAFLLVSVPRSITIAMFIISRTDFNYFLLNLSTLLSFFYFNSTLFILLAKNPPFKENFFSVLSASSSV